MTTEEIYSIIEGLLFIAQSPLSVSRLGDILEQDSDLIRGVLKRIQEDYEAFHRGLLLEEVAGGYQFRTKIGLRPWIHKYRASKPNRLSSSAIETLAMVAYKQPVTRAEIEEIRGVDSSHALRALVEKKLIRITGKKEAPGNPLLYATTPQFLELFGLKDLKALPTLDDIKELEIDALLNPFKQPENLLLPFMSQVGASMDPEVSS